MKVKPLGRPAMEIGFDTFAGVVRSIDEVVVNETEKNDSASSEMSAKKKRSAQAQAETKRSVCISDGKARMTIGIRHKRVKLSVGDEVVIAHYKADGFLPKLAGIHNCSSGAWYLMRQADEYLEGWLHIYRIETWHYAAIVASLIAAIGILTMHLIVGACLLVAIITALVITVKKLRKSKLMLSSVTCKSLAVQLMSEFKDLADTEEGTASVNKG